MKNTNLVKLLATGSIFYALFANNTTNAQEREKPVLFGRTVEAVMSNGKIRCATTEYNEYLQRNPHLAEGEQIESEVVYQTLDANEIITIPVVVHVIHSGQAIGVGRNISDAQVMSQITVLNQDYRRAQNTPGYNNDPVGADTEIQFCLAQRDPQGNATNGINRVNLGNTVWNEYNVETILKPQTRWDPTKYLNIWVCQFGGDLNGTLGYAQFPIGTGLQGLGGTPTSALTDGVIIGYQYFGSSSLASGSYSAPYDKGRTTTHEVGHWLGLRHIWGDNSSCSVNATDSLQDYCPDTPPQDGLNEYCNTNSYSCGSLDMVRNYMDYTNDACMNIFTQDQKTRMRTTMQNGVRRASLKTSNACTPPTASTEDFGLGMISLYPNPTSDMLNIVVPDNYELSGNITIYNTVGQQVYSNSIANTNLYSVNVSGFNSGVYFVKITKENQTKTLQFIKK
jgi:hypothetical protein